MERYTVDQFDESTYVVIDRADQREICLCGNYEGGEDANERADEIARLLNKRD